MTSLPKYYSEMRFTLDITLTCSHEEILSTRNIMMFVISLLRQTGQHILLSPMCHLLLHKLRFFSLISPLGISIIIGETILFSNGFWPIAARTSLKLLLHRDGQVLTGMYLHYFTCDGTINEFGFIIINKLKETHKSTSESDKFM